MKELGQHSVALFVALKNLLFSPHFIVLTLIGNGMVFFFAWLFYLAEFGSNPLVDEKMDAIWWAFTTVTTVGFGDIVPTTMMGRILGILLMLLGTAIFACYVGLIADSFMAVELGTAARKNKRKHVSS